MDSSQNSGTDDAAATDVSNDDSAGAAPAVAPQLPVADLEDTAGAPAVQPASAPLSAQDGELIEKEWVHKAKEIVEGTQMDPYTQSEQINHVKADYIKKRYGRDVQIDD